MLENQELTAGGYAQIDLDGTWHVAKINHIIAVDGHVILCAYIYPPALANRRDQFGALAIPSDELNVANANDYLLLSAETHAVNAMWHFRTRSGGRSGDSVVTFVQKW